MTHASVFSGIGGPEVAASMLGWENLFHCEINPFGRKVLEYWYPKAISYDDITKTDFTPWRGRVDVLTGGFPCQPFSYAGKRRGAEDDRYLWPSMFRCIDEIRPTWVVCENVAGILTMVEQGNVSKVGSEATLFGEETSIYEYRGTFTLERICKDLETHGYDLQPILIPACGVGAPHRRDRVFIVARRLTSDANGSPNGRGSGEDEGKGKGKGIQERDKVREPNQSDKVRSEVRIPEDPLRGRQICGQYEEQRNQRVFRDVGPGNSERLCDKTQRSDSTDPNSNRGHKIYQHLQSGQSDGPEPLCDGGERFASDTDFNRFSHSMQTWGGQSEPERDYCGDRWYDFPTVSPVHRGNDGIPFPLDGPTVPPIPKPPTYGKGDPEKCPFAKWRKESIKAYGNAIVPQVMYEIFRAIEIVENQELRYE